MRNYVAFVHGIGSQSPNDHAHFQEAIRNAFNTKAGSVDGRTPPPDALIWQTAYWAEVTRADQEALKRLLGVSGTIKTLFFTHAADAIACTRVPGGTGKYSNIHKVFAETLRKLSELAACNEGSHTRVPLTVVSHSLGTVIATGAIAAMRAENTFPANLELKRLYTLGSPIALYGLRHSLADFTPPLQVPTWVNFFYPQDIVAFPLQCLGGPWETAVRDQPLSLSGPGSPWRGPKRRLITNFHFARDVIPHFWYFEDRRVLDTIAEALVEEWLAPAPDPA